MTLAKKLYEILFLGLIWGPLAALVTLTVAKTEAIADTIGGGDRGAYALMGVLVVAAWFATEYVLEVFKVDTTYAPD